MTHLSLIGFPLILILLSHFLWGFCENQEPLQYSPEFLLLLRKSLSSPSHRDHPAGSCCGAPELGIQADGCEEKGETWWCAPEAQETRPLSDTPFHSDPCQCPVTPQQSWWASGKQKHGSKNKPHSPIWELRALEYHFTLTETPQWPVNHLVEACVPMLTKTSVTLWLLRRHCAPLTLNFCLCYYVPFTSTRIFTSMLLVRHDSWNA